MTGFRMRKVVYDPNNNAPALWRKRKNSIPIRIDYTEDLHSCSAKRKATHYKTEYRHTFKGFLFSVVLVNTLDN